MNGLAVPSDRAADLRGEIGFAPAFELRLYHADEGEEHTPHGARILRRIAGGVATGRIEATVYPDGGGEYSLRRSDDVTDVSSHVMLRDGKGEWLYLRTIGYSRQDYHRVTS